MGLGGQFSQRKILDSPGDENRHHAHITSGYIVESRLADSDEEVLMHDNNAGIVKTTNYSVIQENKTALS